MGGIHMVPSMSTGAASHSESGVHSKAATKSLRPVSIPLNEQSSRSKTTTRTSQTIIVIVFSAAEIAILFLEGLL